MFGPKNVERTEKERLYDVAEKHRKIGSGRICPMDRDKNQGGHPSCPTEGFIINYNPLFITF
jgi:hypothetical protein